MATLILPLKPLGNISIYLMWNNLEENTISIHENINVWHKSKDIFYLTIKRYHEKL